MRFLWNKSFNNLRFLTNRGELESYRTWVYTLQHDSACRNQPTKGVSHPLSLSQVQLVHCCNMFSVTTPTHCQVLYGLSEENFCYTKCSNWKQTKFYFNSWLVRETKIGISIVEWMNSVIRFLILHAQRTSAKNVTRMDIGSSFENVMSWFIFFILFNNTFHVLKLNLKSLQFKLYYQKDQLNLWYKPRLSIV